MCTSEFMVIMDVPCDADMHILRWFRIKWKIMITMVVEEVSFTRKVVNIQNVVVVYTCDDIIISLQ